MAALWEYLVRFEATNGKVYLSLFQEAPKFSSNGESEDVSYLGYETFEAALADKHGERVKLSKILQPTIVQEPEIVCIGTNYRKHAEEAGLPVPLDPVMWYKPKRSLAAPGAVYVPRAAQEAFLDFEGELVIVIGQNCRDVSESEADRYILGYTIGNDLTARHFQDPKRGGGQFTRCKAFDNFAPIGPWLVEKGKFGSLSDKKVLTTVNGKEQQNSDLDLIHGPQKLVSFLSQGTTLTAGTLIMTGSPPGVGWFQNPKVNLKNGDVVEVEISGIGKLSNTMQFE